MFGPHPEQASSCQARQYVRNSGELCHFIVERHDAVIDATALHLLFEEPLEGSLISHSVHHDPSNAPLPSKTKGGCDAPARLMTTIASVIKKVILAAMASPYILCLPILTL